MNGWPEFPADGCLDGERESHVHGVADRMPDHRMRPVHGPAKALLPGGSPQLVFLGVVEVGRRQPRLAFAEGGVRHFPRRIRFKRAQIVLQPGHEGHVLHRLAVEAGQQVPQHGRVGLDVFLFRVHPLTTRCRTRGSAVRRPGLPAGSPPNSGPHSHGGRHGAGSGLRESATTSQPSSASLSTRADPAIPLAPTTRAVRVSTVSELLRTSFLLASLVLRRARCLYRVPARRPAWSGRILRSSSVSCRGTAATVREAVPGKPVAAAQ